MSRQGKVLRGRRLNKGGHSTFSPSALRILNAAKRDLDVSRIIFGPMRKTGSGPIRIKFKHIPAGLEIDIRGGGTIQTFYIYTSEPQTVEKKLQAVWDDG
jgi:hypothetical protein